MIHALLVDDDPTVLASLAAALEAPDGEFRVSGRAMGFREAVGLVEGATPIDVAVVDLGLPDGHGADLIALLRDARPDAASLVFTVFADETSIFRALHAGAQGYLLKDASPEEVREAIRHAWTGGAPLTPEVARKVIESFRPKPAAPRTTLTPREREVLELLCHGSTYSEVGRMLSIGEGTVHTHVKSIYRKLDVTSKTEATKVAIQQRLFVP